MKLAELLSISGPTPIRQLSEGQLKEVQRALSLLGYPVGDIDGLIGPRTRNAWSEFFTGRKITDFIDETKTDFVRARRCINGNDKAHEIAVIAKKFLAAL
jgi:hypothetical protein